MREREREREKAWYEREKQSVVNTTDANVFCDRDKVWRTIQTKVWSARQTKRVVEKRKRQGVVEVEKWFRKLEKVSKSTVIERR